MLKPEHQYSFYILSNKKNGTLYMEMTIILEKRINEHTNKMIEGFLR
ncbi:GIY-YIG nuclease family protein [Aquimarina sp. M1]